MTLDPVRIRSASLRFEDPGLEAQFLEEYRRGSRWQVRLAILVAVVVYVAFAWLDVWMAPDLSAVFLTLRILVAAVFGLALAVTFAPVRLTAREVFVCIAVMAAAAGILRMMTLATAVVARWEGQLGAAGAPVAEPEKDKAVVVT